MSSMMGVIAVVVTVVVIDASLATNYWLFPSYSY